MTNFNVEVIVRLKGDDGIESDVARLYHGEISNPSAALRVARDSMEALEYSIAREQAQEEADAKPFNATEMVAGMDYGVLPPGVFVLPRGGEPTGLGALLGQLGLVQPIPDQRRFRSLPEDLKHPMDEAVKRHPSSRNQQFPRPDQIIPFINQNPVGLPVPPQFDLSGPEEPRDGYPVDRPADTQPPMASPFIPGGPDVAPVGSLAPFEDCGMSPCEHAPDGGNHPVAGTPGE